MDIGIGLPNAVRGVDRAVTVQWAPRADQAGFSARRQRAPRMLSGGAAEFESSGAAKYAAGWTLGCGPPEVFSEGRAKLHGAWGAEGREGEPRTMALFYYGLGDRAEEAARVDLAD